MPGFSPSEIFNAAVRKRGVDSIVTMPISYIGGTLGRIAEYIGLRSPESGHLGKKIIEKYIIRPTEYLTSSAGRLYNRALGEVPGFGALTRYKLQPRDILDAQKALGLTEEQVGKLVQKAHRGELVTHRLTAPLESNVTRALIMPALGGMYLHHKLDKYQAGAAQRAKHQKLVEKRLNRIRRFAGLEKQSEAMNKHQDLMKKAASCIREQESIISAQQAEIRNLKEKTGLFKQAAELIASGMLDPSNIDVWVEQNSTIYPDEMNIASHNHQTKAASELREYDGDGENLYDLYRRASDGPTNQTHNKYATSIGFIDNDFDKNLNTASNHPTGARSAMAVMVDFVRGANSELPGV